MKALRESFKDQGFNHIWGHTFSADQSARERKQWIRDRLAMTQEMDIALIHRETENGVEFAFYDADHYTAFALNMIPVVGNIPNNDWTQHFVCPVFQDVWTSLACSVLDQLGIEYQIEQNGLSSHFHFSRADHYLIFARLAQSGDLDHMTETVGRMQAMMTRLEGPGGPEQAL